MALPTLRGIVIGCGLLLLPCACEVTEPAPPGQGAGGAAGPSAGGSGQGMPGAGGPADPGTSTVPTDPGYCHGDVPCAPTAIARPSAGCMGAMPTYSAGSPFVVSTAPHVNGYAEAALTLPEVGQTVRDPDFGTCLTRATPRGWMNGYSRFSAFNADATRLLVRKDGGDWYVLDTSRLGEPTQAIVTGGDAAAARWHGRDPDVLFYLSDSKLIRFDVRSRQPRTAFDPATLPELAGCSLSAVTLGGDEGESSAGSRYWGFHVETSGACHGSRFHLVTTDLQAGQSWVHHMPAVSELPNNSAISPTGKYLIVNFQEDRSCGDRKATMANPCGVMAYSLHLDQAKMLAPVAGHHDEALGKNGHDFVVVKSDVSDFIEAIDVETLEVIQIAAMNPDGVADYEYHVSGNSWATPGWVILSEDSHNPSGHYLNRQIVAVEIAPVERARVIHLAHHRTRSTNYWTQECHASVSLDGTRVAFHSNWYGGEEEGDNILFYLELPPGLLAQP